MDIARPIETVSGAPQAAESTPAVKPCKATEEIVAATVPAPPMIKGLELSTVIGSAVTGSGSAQVPIFSSNINYGGHSLIQESSNSIFVSSHFKHLSVLSQDRQFV